MEKIKVVLQLISMMLLVVVEAILTESLFPILPQLNLLFSNLNESTVPSDESDVSSLEDSFRITALFSGSSIITVILSPLVGFLIDVLSLNLVAIVTMLLQLCCCLIYAFGKTYLHFIIGRILFNTITAGVFTIASVVIIEVVENEKTKCRLLAIPACIYGSSSLGQIYTANLYPRLGRGLTFIPLAITVIISIVLFLYGRWDTFSSNMVKRTANTQSENKSLSKLVIGLFEKIIVVPMVLSVILCIIRFSLNIVLPIWTTDVLMATTKERGNIWWPSTIFFVIVIFISTYTMTYKINVFITAGIYSICSSISAFVLPFCSNLTLISFVIAVPSAMEPCARYVTAAFVSINTEKLPRLKPLKGFIIGLICCSQSSTSILAFLTPVIYEYLGFNLLCIIIGSSVLFAGFLSFCYSYLYRKMLDEVEASYKSEEIALLDHRQG